MYVYNGIVCAFVLNVNVTLYLHFLFFPWKAVR